MTTNAKKKNLSERDKGIVIRLPLQTAIFFDIIFRYVRGTRQSLYERVWSAGMREVFGISEEELRDCDLRILPPDIEPPRDDLRKMTDMICGE